jgi:uncharacterized protein YodC (DUF2158 family)
MGDEQDSSVYLDHESGPIRGYLSHMASAHTTDHASNLVLGVNMTEIHKEIRKGDTVRLSSGGWKMTVVEIEGDGAHCQWWSGSQVQRAWASFDCLQRVKRANRVLDGQPVPNPFHRLLLWLTRAPRTTRA